MANISDRIRKLKDALSKGLYEKDEALRLALLTSIAGESIFLLGAPGCAKSMIARLVTQAFKTDSDRDIKFFETLLNQFSTPEDVFGNISLKALNGEGENGKEEYRRLTENMLPDADIAFLDEIWKASPAILNTLLTIINERKFHNGSKVEDVPLKALLAASNELPAKNRGLEALYDRFILRVCIDFIKDESNFFEMIEGASNTELTLSDDIKQLQISNTELKEWKKQIDNISLSEEAKAVISAIRKELTLQNDKLNEEEKANGEAFVIGDRRWKKIVHILKTSAFLNDREQVDLMDCGLIEYCIWSTEKQHKKVREIVKTCIKQHGLDCDTKIDEINEDIEELDTYINENFYKYKKSPVTKNIDNELCYKIDFDNNNYWINSNGLYDYKSLKKTKDVYNYSFDKDKGIISWEEYRYSNYIEKNIYFHKHYVKDENIFNKPAVLEATQEKTDRDKYQPIKNDITSEIEKLDEFIQKTSEPYKANLFTDQFYCNVIMSAITDAKKDLEDAIIILDKKRARYQ